MSEGQSPEVADQTPKVHKISPKNHSRRRLVTAALAGAGLLAAGAGLLLSRKRNSTDEPPSSQAENSKHFRENQNDNNELNISQIGEIGSALVSRMMLPEAAARYGLDIFHPSQKDELARKMADSSLLVRKGHPNGMEDLHLIEMQYMPHEGLRPINLFQITDNNNDVLQFGTELQVNLDGNLQQIGASGKIAVGSQAPAQLSTLAKTIFAFEEDDPHEERIHHASAPRREDVHTTPIRTADHKFYGNIEMSESGSAVFFVERGPAV